MTNINKNANRPATMLFQAVSTLVELSAEVSMNKKQFFSEGKRHSSTLNLEYMSKTDYSSKQSGGCYHPSRQNRSTA